MRAIEAAELMNQSYKKRLAKALEEIKRAASGGYNRTMLFSGCTDKLAEELQQLGYRIERRDDMDAMWVRW